MPQQKNIGRKVRCPKCSKHFYDLGRKNTICPACHRASIISDGSIARVLLVIKAGQHNDPKQGWTDGCATRNRSGAVYLNCQFEVVGGEHTGKHFFSLIGLHTPKGPWWGNKGRKTLRDILNSAYGISDSDYSPRAIAIRQLTSLSSFDRIEFIAEIGVREAKDGMLRNELKSPVTPDDERFAEFSAPEDSLSSKDAEESTDNLIASKSFADKDFKPAWLSRMQ